METHDLEVKNLRERMQALEEKVKMLIELIFFDVFSPWFMRKTFLVL